MSPPDPGELLVEAARGAHEVVLIAPYMKERTLRSLIEHFDRDAALTCVTRWLPGDIDAGVSDIACRQSVLNRGGAFRLHTSLHAKYYRLDDEVFVGSVNVTASAFGWAVHPNVEILCQPGSDFDPVRFEELVIADSREVGDDEFAHWQALAADGSSLLPIRPADNAIPSDWRPTTRDPQNLIDVYFRGENAIASRDEQAAVASDLSALRLSDGMPENLVRAVAATSLLAAPFSLDALRVLRWERREACRFLAAKYAATEVEARRDLETSENWLVFFVPDLVSQTRSTGPIGATDTGLLP